MLKIEKKSETEFKLVGRFDATQAEKVSEELDSVNDSVTIDLAELDYISSMGLSVFVKTYKRLNENGHKVRLTNLDDHIRDIFKYTRLDQIFSIE